EARREPRRERGTRAAAREQPGHAVERRSVEEDVELGEEDARSRALPRERRDEEAAGASRERRERVPESASTLPGRHDLARASAVERSSTARRSRSIARRSSSMRASSASGGTRLGSAHTMTTRAKGSGILKWSQVRVSMRRSAS